MVTNKYWTREHLREVMDDFSADFKNKKYSEKIEYEIWRKIRNIKTPIVSYNNTIISDTRELISQEVENLIKSSKQIIDNIPMHKSIVEKGEIILTQLNPQFAQQKEQEQKISNLETKVGSMESKLDDIATMLTKVLQK